MNEILNIIHKTIYQFIDASEDDVLMSEKDKLLLKVNKAICNNLKVLNVPVTNAGDLISRRTVIEWLKDKDIIKTKNQEENARRELAELPSTQPNLQPTCNQLATDFISRQELLNAISQKEYGHDYDEDTDILGLKYVDIIKRMPSVEPERKTGHWHLLDECANEGWYCDQCHKKVFRADFSNTMRKYKFCPNCGSYNGG